MMTMNVVTLLLSIAVLVVCALKLLKMATKRSHFVAMINKLPGPPTIPLLGNALDDMVPRNQMLLNWGERHMKYGPLYRSWSGSLAFVHLTKPEHIEVILRSTTHLEKPWVYHFLHQWLGLGLLNSKGSKWHSRRKLITPTFHFKILETFCEVFAEKSQILVDKLKSEVAQLGEVGFDLFPFINRCALDIICHTAMGTEIHAQEKFPTEYVSAVSNISEIIIERAFSPHLHSDLIFNLTSKGSIYKHSLKVLHSFTKQVIQERKEEYLMNRQMSSRSDGETSVGSKRRLTFLELLLATSMDDDSWTDEDLLDEVETFMFAGHDTTTSGTSWALFMIASYPDIQAKVIEELDEIFQGSNRPITMRDLKSMRYLECVIKETLRLYPSIPYIGRKLTEDIELDGYSIPAGCTVTTHIFYVHRDPYHFPDPERFDPERFLPERAQGRHPYAYIPFSAGPRNCVGQKFAMLEQKTMLASVLRNFKLRAIEARDDIKLISELVLRSESGMKLVLTPR